MFEIIFLNLGSVPMDSGKSGEKWQWNREQELIKSLIGFQYKINHVISIPLFNVFLGIPKLTAKRKLDSGRKKYDKKTKKTSDGL